MKPEEQFSSLIRDSRLSPPLPPRFQENVWRRIETSDAPAKSQTWLDTLAALILRPRFALATAAVLVFAGVLLGTREGSQSARHDAQARYVAYIAPDPLH